MSLLFIWNWNFTVISYTVGFPGSSAGEESTCNARDPGLIPGAKRSPREGIGYPCQYSWAFLVAQTVKNLPAIQETLVWSLGWEDPLEEGMATHASILAWRIPMDRRAWWATVHGVPKSWTWLSFMCHWVDRQLWLSSFYFHFSLLFISQDITS